MSSPQPDSRSFLLSDLTETERRRFEERILLEDEFFEEVMVGETELLDQAVRGELSSSDRARFERRLESNPHWGERRGFASVLNQLLEGSTSAIEEAPPVAVASSRGHLPIWLPLAASILLAVGSAGVLGWSLGQRGSDAVEIASRSAIEARMAHLESTSRRDLTSLDQVREELKARSLEVAALRDEAATLAQQVADLQSTPPSVAEASPLSEPSPRTAVLLLGLGAVRSEGSSPRHEISPSTERLRLQLNPEGDIDYASFAVVVRDARGRDVWRVNDLSVTDLDWGPVIEVELSRADLPDGQYEVELLGVESPGHARDVGFYRLHLES